MRDKNYSQILDNLQEVRSNIVADSQQELIFTGMMPPAAQKELKVVADIIASVFKGLVSLGAELKEDPKNPALATLSINGKTYSCLKSQLEDKTSSIPVTPSNINVINDNIAAKKPADKPVESIKESTKEPVEDIEEEDDLLPVSADNEEDEYEDEPSYEEIPEEEDTYEEDPDFEDEDVLDDNGDPIVSVSGDIGEDKRDMRSIDEFIPDVASDDDSGMTIMETRSEPEVPENEGTTGVVSLTGDDDISSVSEEQVTEAPVITGRAKIIGGGPANISVGINKDEFFIDEQSKAESEFVYCYSKISVMHTDMGGGGKPEEMLVLVAPLKICQYASTSVPIVVTIVHNGKSVTASSYDILEEGKNIVTIDIDDFYFLCRGSFDDKGKFKASFVTTGISSQQGDRITPLFSKTYGNGAAKETRNGHIKFHYSADSGSGSVEVIPFGVQGEKSEDFVAIVKNPEFVDYYLVSKSLKANTKAIIYSEGGVMNELVCHWEDDTLVADLI